MVADTRHQACAGRRGLVAGEASRAREGLDAWLHTPPPRRSTQQRTRSDARGRARRPPVSPRRRRQRHRRRRPRRQPPLLLHRVPPRPLRRPRNRPRARALGARCEAARVLAPSAVRTPPGSAAPQGPTAARLRRSAGPAAHRRLSQRLASCAMCNRSLVRSTAAAPSSRQRRIEAACIS
ncbi:MAG: hypothetical protein CBD47_04770 [Synechococcus sp. TMED187]|nr:MAG: hypothetical protein CBD47_04770 [Synechococcus sp. TMED187]